MIFIFFMSACSVFIPVILAIIFKMDGCKMKLWQIIRKITR